MDNPPPSTWDNLFYPPDLNDYTYFRQALTAANLKAWMADAAVLAYNRSRRELLPSATFHGIFVNAGFADAKLVQKSDLTRSTLMYFAYRAEFAVLSFRGTEKSNVRNFLSDFDALPARPDDPGGAVVHRGFSEALDIVWPDALELLKTYRRQNPTSPIYFTGHSLGAALASLAIWRFQAGQTDRNVSLYTIGCPRAGNRRFCDELSARATRGIFRFLDGNDLVTHVPPADFGYDHPAGGIYIGGRPYQQTGETLTILKDADEAVLDDLSRRPPPEDFADHSPVRYQYYLWK
jgi:hypothetical protein